MKGIQTKINICWVTDDEKHTNLLKSDRFEIKKIIADTNKTPELDNIDIIIIYGNMENPKNKYRGIQWFKNFITEKYKKQKSNISITDLPKIIIYSFEAKDKISEKFPFIKDKSVKYLQLPFKIEELEKSLKKLTNFKYKEEDLKEFIIKTSDLREKWNILLHNFLNKIIKNNCEDNLVDDLKQDIQYFFPEEIETLNNLKLNLKDKTIEEITSTVNTLKINIGLEKKIDEIKPVSLIAPSKLRKIMIADDNAYIENNGYLEIAPWYKGLIEVLKSYNYVVIKRMITKSEEIDLVYYYHPDIILTDWYFPTEEKSNKFIKDIKEWNDEILIIATSRATLDEKKLKTSGVKNCSGISYCPIAIHNIICQEALERNEELIEFSKNEAKIKNCITSTKIISMKIETRIDARRTLPGKIKEVIEFAKSCQFEKKLSDEIIDTLTKYSNYTEELPWEKTAELKEECLNLLTKSREIKDFDKGLSHWNFLHKTLHQYIIIPIWENIKKMRNDIEQLIEDLKDINKDTIDLKKAFDKALETNSIKDLENIYTTLNNLTFPEIKKNISYKEFVPTKKFCIIIVEDEPIWQKFLKKSVELVQSRLSGEYYITWTLFDNTQDAIKHIHGLKDIQPVAILDMGLPEKPNGTSSRINGHMLIDVFRRYKYNVPCVIMTTPPDLLGDILSTYEHGISDYMLKGDDNIEDLINNICNIIKESQKIKIQFENIDKYSVKIKNRIIELPLKLFQIFYTLCELSFNDNRYFLMEEITVRQKEIFEKKSYFPDAAAELIEKYNSFWKKRFNEIDVFNVINIWNSKKEEAREVKKIDLKKAFDKFKAEKYLYKNKALPMIKAINNNIDEKDLPNKFQEIFGDIKKEYIPQDICLIREKILNTLTVTGLTISKDEIILERDSAYRVNGDIYFDVDLKNNKPLKKLKLLIVEDVKTEQEKIKNILKLFNFEIEVAENTKKAIEITRTFNPHILCLDMHIPLDNEATVGIETGGLEALKGIRKVNPYIKVVIPSTYSNKSYLNNKAKKLNVPVINFVDKSDSNWEGKLSQIIYRIKREIEDRAILPRYISSSSLPVLKVEVLEGSDPGHGKLLLDINGKNFEINQLQGKLLFLLLQKKSVSYDEIDEYLYNKTKQGEKRKNIVKRLRKFIETWDISDKELKKEILETIKNGLRLNVNV
jgi:CheY-like chemotaxis protein